MDGDTTPSDWWVWMRTTPRGKLVMKSLIHQLLLAVKFCKDNSIVHRDIKPSNIVVCFEKSNHSCSAPHPSQSSDVYLRLIDFGSSVDKYAKRYLYGKSGPTSGEQYQFSMPPEAIVDRYWVRYPLSTKYDSWTVGQTILELLLGTPDVFRLTDYEAIGFIKGINSLDAYSIIRLAGMAEQCIGLPRVIELEKMKKLNTCSEDGYAAYIHGRDPLHLGFPDVELLRLVRLLLRGDPDSRIGVDEALDHPYFTASTKTSTFYYNIAMVVCLVLCISARYVFKVWIPSSKKKENNRKKKEKKKKNKKRN